MTLVPEAAVRRLDAVPFGFRPDGTLLIAMADPRNLLAVDDLAMLTDRSIAPVVVTREDLDTLIARIGRLDGLAEDDDEDDAADHEVARLAALEQAADDGPTVKLVRSIIAQGIENGASDIHFDPDGGDLRVRYRIDGIVRDVTRVTVRQSARVISRIKDPQRPRHLRAAQAQDGRMSLMIDGRRIDIRVAIVPLSSPRRWSASSASGSCGGCAATAGARRACRAATRGSMDGGEVEVYEAVGCPRCGDSGYRGRIGLFEVMTVTDRIRSLIVRHATASEMMQAAIEEGMRPLREDGLAKVRAGETSLAEVARVTD